MNYKYPQYWWDDSSLSCTLTIIGTEDSETSAVTLPLFCVSSCNIPLGKKSIELLLKLKDDLQNYLPTTIADVNAIFSLKNSIRKST